MLVFLSLCLCLSPRFCFFFNDTATTEIYTLSLHDALPISTSAPHPATAATCPASSARSSRTTGRGYTTPRPRCSRSEEHTSELQSHVNLVCRLLLEKKKHTTKTPPVRSHDHSYNSIILSLH